MQFGFSNRDIGSEFRAVGIDFDDLGGKRMALRNSNYPMKMIYPDCGIRSIRTCGASGASSLE
jgi:hypothetical protein